MGKLTENEKLYCLYRGVLIPQNADEEEIYEADYFRSIFMNSGKMIEKTPFFILIGISNLTSPKLEKPAKKFIKDLKNGVDLGNDKITNYMKLCITDYKKCCEDFKDEFLDFLNEDIVNKVEKLVWHKIQSDTLDFMSISNNKEFEVIELDEDESEIKIIYDEEVADEKSN